MSVTGLNHFYYVRDFTDMRCKHSRVLSIIRERLHREPSDGDVFIVMLRNRRIVRMFSFDNHMVIGMPTVTGDMPGIIWNACG
ncbi:IS66 family insertion sequence element accessory protein TnpB [Bacteroides fluxus]|uniref:IS66 family insertion sequence element accessory protein TnpB n=1 Tax=Bacteroides fluxus TaxID=626930 RepID=UPI003461B1D9